MSYACPYAHRTLLVRALKGLEDAIPIVVVHPIWNVIDSSIDRRGWVFGSEKNGTDFYEGVNVSDYINHKDSLRQVYHIHNPSYEGAFSVPLLFDTKTQSIVNNNSAEIVEVRLVLNKNTRHFILFHIRITNSNQWNSFLIDLPTDP